MLHTPVGEVVDHIEHITLLVLGEALMPFPTGIKIQRCLPAAVVLTIV
jgi:hypothetical protein